MAGSIYLPVEVKNSIKEHFSREITEAEAGFSSVAEDEDSITGFLFGRLRTSRLKSVRVPHPEGLPDETWSWRIDCAKFRGRGKAAAESSLGADGIVELVVMSGKIDGRSSESKKSLLFQAKIQNKKVDQNLAKQCLRLSTWREAASVFFYSEGEFLATDLDDAIRVARQGSAIAPNNSLLDLLGGRFLDCQVGDTNLEYDAAGRILRWMTQDHRIVSVHFSIPHRARITVKRPVRENLKNAERISVDELIDNRMFYSPYNLLGVASDASLEELKRAKKRLSLAYHQDGLVNLTMTEIDLSKRRMQEINSAFETARGSTRGPYWRR